MPVSIIPSFLFFTIISSITPGPANLASISAAFQFGKKPALKQWTGIFTGFFCIATAASIFTYFLGTVFTQYVSKLVFIGAAYLVYLAIKMLRRTYSENRELEKAPNFFSGLLVQFTNFKMMIFCVTCISTYMLPYRQDFISLFFTGVLLTFMCPSACFLWIFAGVSLQKLFKNHQKIINIILSLSLIACAVSIVIQNL